MSCITKSANGLAPDFVSGDFSFDNFPIIVYPKASENTRRQRCDCDDIEPCPTDRNGQSYVYFYNYSQYDVWTHIHHYGREYYEVNSNDPWIKFVNAPPAYRHFNSYRFGPNGSKEGYFVNGNNQTAGLHTGTLGIEIYTANNGYIGGGLYYLEDVWPGWGKEWLRCGQDYTFDLKEQ